MGIRGPTVAMSGPFSPAGRWGNFKQHRSGRVRGRISPIIGQRPFYLPPLPPSSWSSPVEGPPSGAIVHSPTGSRERRWWTPPSRSSLGMYFIVCATLQEREVQPSHNITHTPTPIARTSHIVHGYTHTHKHEDTLTATEMKRQRREGRSEAERRRMKPRNAAAPVSPPMKRPPPRPLRCAITAARVWVDAIGIVSGVTDEEPRETLNRKRKRRKMERRATREKVRARRRGGVGATATPTRTRHTYPPHTHTPHIRAGCRLSRC